MAVVLYITYICMLICLASHFLPQPVFMSIICIAAALFAAGKIIHEIINGPTHIKVLPYKHTSSETPTNYRRFDKYM